MTVDHSIDYSFVGKGAKRRQRLQPADAPERRVKLRPHRQRPEIESRKVKHVEKSEGHHTVIGVKARIRLLVIDRDASFSDIVDVMKREECPVSGVTIGNVRADMREVLKLLEKEGLLKTNTLARRRKKVRTREAT
ncbi:hypothetical protein JQ620_15350 [Bradyrhizobium sp. AUGA SZCCT0274]|uniref:hypothetical protein n=1 Tax=Bradyrhizobium sp. AUGA SZCCT0274 TaxID=2807670 RepID=UPI001BAB8EA6|nr:hypothetical protein [Bradyrhizobium sp. AUGA SZCCT0274]MBR1241505.1 hypothetical protein [Bradyrhizobium sp. AUGA SZCCT0274]